jgi:hypothetical protein
MGCSGVKLIADHIAKKQNGKKNADYRRYEIDPVIRQRDRVNTHCYIVHEYLQHNSSKTGPDPDKDSGKNEELPVTESAKYTL